MAWEYRIVASTESDEDDEAMLNELGAEGWELIAVHLRETVTEPDDEEDFSEEYVEEVYYLKRQKG